MMLLVQPRSVLVLLLASLSIGTTTAVNHQSQSPSTRDQPNLSSCVARSPTTGLYFDLNTISLLPLDKDDKGQQHRHRVHHRSSRDESWHARGHDYGANFTLNFCAPVVENLKDVVGLERPEWKSVGAYYVKNGRTYSIG